MSTTMPSTQATLIFHWVFGTVAPLIIALRLGFPRTPPSKTLSYTRHHSTHHVPKRPHSASPAATTTTARRQRLARWAATNRFDVANWLSVAAAVCALARLVLIHFVLTWGTNNIPGTSDGGVDGGILRLSSTELQRREVGSVLALANRAVYTTFLWLEKLVLLDLYRHLLRNQRGEKIVLWSFLAVMGVTYVACQVVTFTECVPFHLFWQVEPDPGPCAQAQRNLFACGALNILTELMLLILPLPMVFVSMKLANWRRKLPLVVIFLLGACLIGMAVTRLAISGSHSDSQNHRTVWTSAEVMTSAVVVNAPTIYGLWNKRRAARAGAGAGDASGTGPGTSSSRRGRGGGRRDGQDADGEVVRLTTKASGSLSGLGVGSSPGRSETRSERGGGGVVVGTRSQHGGERDDEDVDGIKLMV